MVFKKRLFLFTVFILIVFLLLTYQSIKGKKYLSGIPSYPLRLVSRVSSAVMNNVTDFFHAYILVVGKEEENRKLRERIMMYEQAENRYIESERERKRLRKLLELKSSMTQSVVVAEVYARDPTSWFQILWINKGSHDGIDRSMIAVTPAGPVGRIHAVYDRMASILLVTDINSSVAVRMQGSGVDGILVGRGGRRCFVKYVQRDVDVGVGERVITSGLDGLYPKGLFIGSVTKVRKDGDELFQEIEVEPAQNLSQIEEVIILRR
jgi:rod shape-determining protein MreC